MLYISQDTIEEKVKDVISETGLKNPRSAIKRTQTFKSYNLTDVGAIEAFRLAVNAQFKPYGLQIELSELRDCKTVGDLIDRIWRKEPKAHPKALAAKHLAKLSRAAALPKKGGK